MQGGRRRRLGKCGWSRERRPVASRGRAHLRPSGGGGCEWEGVWLVVCGVCVMLVHGEGPFVSGVHCGGL